MTVYICQAAKPGGLSGIMIAGKVHSANPPTRQGEVKWMVGNIQSNHKAADVVIDDTMGIASAEDLLSKLKEFGVVQSGRFIGSKECPICKQATDKIPTASLKAQLAKRPPRVDPLCEYYSQPFVIDKSKPFA